MVDTDNQTSQIIMAVQNKLDIWKYASIKYFLFSIGKKMIKYTIVSKILCMYICSLDEDATIFTQVILINNLFDNAIWAISNSH